MGFRLPPGHLGWTARGPGHRFGDHQPVLFWVGRSGVDLAAWLAQSDPVFHRHYLSFAAVDHCLGRVDRALREHGLGLAIGASALAYLLTAYLGCWGLGVTRG